MPDHQSLLRRLQHHAPNSTQLVGFLTLVVSGAIILLLTGVTLTGTVTALIFLAPILLLTSPIWVPIVFLLFLTVAGFLSFCGVGVAAIAGATWMYKYFTGRHPVGSDRVDYARNRILDTATRVKDYAGEYGGILQRGGAKDAAPGA